MLRAMVKDGILIPGDYEKTDGTGCPRYLANSRSHRSTLVRRDLLASAPQARFVITKAGRRFTASWLDQSGKSIKEYEMLIQVPD